MNVLPIQWVTKSGFRVEPIGGTYRNVLGGYAVDVRCEDPRITVRQWTEAAENVVDAFGDCYAE